MLPACLNPFTPTGILVTQSHFILTLKYCTQSICNFTYPKLLKTWK